MRRWAFLVTLGLCLFLPVPVQAQAPVHTFDSNGVKIVYQDHGKGEAVVLVHGFCVDAQMQWGMPGIIRGLSTNYRVIALDNRGHGKSDKPHDPDKYGVEMVEDLIRLLDHLQIKKAHFVGYSMGGFITCKLVTLHPDRVLSATLGGAGWPREERVPFLEDLAESLEKHQSLEPLLVYLTPPGQPKPTPERVKQVNSFILAINDPKALAAVLRGSKKLIIAEEDLKKVKVPLLALVGDLDPLKASVEALKPVTPQVRIVVLKEADHMNAFSKAEFLKELKTFLAAHGEEK